MYIPAQFRTEDLPTIHAVMRDARLANLVTAGAGGLVATLLPMLLDADEGEFGTLYAHLARANPQWRTGAGQEALVIFDGPDAYVSPAWYPSKQEHGKVVPTWNYIAVHAYGPVEFTEEPEQLLRLVTRLTERHEGARAEPWAVDDAPPRFVEAQLRGIVGVRIPITRLEGKRKLSQNRSAEDKAGVKAGLLREGSALDQAVMALVPD